MFAFRPSSISCSGLLWKSPWRLSSTRKANLRKRLKAVDRVIAAVAESGVQTRSLVKALALPTESDMEARDKYTTFDPHGRNFRKSVHKVPKWTKLTLRENPKGF
ncbi:mitochondrial ribosomal protein L31-domain-containing protein [Dioszegia hungarica]|uniref:Mitochondrial ribosomal protein L31-domain-containing protein n=1 Tax=Dioszegia hungarica TaxID=4972 RepID=A0AA38H3Q7_9TREE|nr:mitochondrial ribosomal protein L31-domain-containing protein [Dioszegia hungarica]KAI9634082.1 mitochondrial ribosomal protein L31-domain-containing protein [Dioszegia hungarica]